MASSSGHGPLTTTIDEPDVKPDSIDLETFKVEDNPFAFSPGQLSKLINPKSLSAFYKLGGLSGLENGLRSDQAAGLSIDESKITGTVTFEEATNCSERPPLQEPPRSFSESDHSDMCRFHSQRDEKLTSPTIDERPSLVVEVKNVHSRLVKLQAKCTQIEQGRYRSNEKNSDLISVGWEALEAINRTLLDKDYNLSIAALSLSPPLQNLRKLTYNHSLQSRNLRRFNDCLLPLLRREQDLESAQQWTEMMKLSSSLIDILGNPELLTADEEDELLDTIDQIEAILMELHSWFKRKYKSLNCKKDVTEEQNLVDIIFEFPNNIRHTCTTMPWTIRPALLVLWGVCWMFIIGAGQPGHEELKALDPLVSPVPAVYDFYGDFPYFDIGDGPSDSIIDDTDGTGYDSQGILGDFVFENIDVNDPISALTLSQSTPQDPNFLSQDLMSRNGAENAGLLGRDSTEPSSAASIQSSSLGASLSTGKTCAGDVIGSADVSGSDDRKINSDDGVPKRKPRFVCRSCQQSFATSFTLTRHQTEAHQLKPPSSEEVFPCPNPGCKRSSEKSAFKRHYHLKRHLITCKHHQEYLFQPDDQTCSRSASASTPTSHRPDVETEQAARASKMSKRPRPEDDEGSDSFVVEILKKYKNMKEEVKQKKDAYLLAEEKLKTFEKKIRDLTGCLNDS